MRQEAATIAAADLAAVAVPYWCRPWAGVLTSATHISGGRVGYVGQFHTPL